MIIPGRIVHEVEKACHVQEPQLLVTRYFAHLPTQYKSGNGICNHDTSNILSDIFMILSRIEHEVGKACRAQEPQT